MCSAGRVKSTHLEFGPLVGGLPVPFWLSGEGELNGSAPRMVARQARLSDQESLQQDDGR